MPSLPLPPSFPAGRGLAALPAARGPLTTWLFRRLVGRPTLAELPPSPDDALVDDDFHLALHTIHDLTYRPVPGVHAACERDPLVLALGSRLEDELLAAVRSDVAPAGGEIVTRRAGEQGAGPVVDDLLEQFDGPSLSSFMAERGTRQQFQELMIHRSAYQLKEADPHTMGLARLEPGPRKAAYTEIQFDEYGEGRPAASHAELFAMAMAQAGLGYAYGSYVDVLPGTTLATGNLLTLFAGRRALLAPLVGHLALFEMTSVLPMSRYAEAATRLGFPPAVRRFYDVHVEADQHHGELARRVLLGDDPASRSLDPAEIVFGAHALLRVEDRFARALLDAWAAGASSLRG